MTGSEPTPGLNLLARQVDSDVDRDARHAGVFGESGLWILICGELTFFGVLFVTYMGARGRNVELFDDSQLTLNRDIGLTYTLLLLTSSLLLAIAMSSLRSAGQRHAPALIAGAFLLGLAFIVLKAFEYKAKFDAGLFPGTNNFYMWYFSLTGYHMYHLIIGMGLLGTLFVYSRRYDRLTRRNVAMMQSAAVFWHMVDAIWLVLFALIYLVR